MYMSIKNLKSINDVHSQSLVTNYITNHYVYSWFIIITVSTIMNSLV